MRHKRRFIMAALEMNKHHSHPGSQTERADSKPSSVQSLMGLKMPQAKSEVSKMAKVEGLQDEKSTKVEVVVVD